MNSAITSKFKKIKNQQSNPQASFLTVIQLFKNSCSVKVSRLFFFYFLKKECCLQYVPQLFIKKKNNLELYKILRKKSWF